MQTVNEEQAEYWGKSESGIKWLTYEDQIDRVFQPVLDLVLERAELSEGMRVLDIGCGTGASTLAAARLVGPSGHVLGVDISAQFLDRARARAAAEGAANVDFQLADAQVAPFEPQDRDAAISRFGVMFFSDNVAAFANIAKALKPGARMTFAAWGELSGNPWFRIPHVAATSVLGNPPKIDRNGPGPLAFHDIDRVTGLMAQAGLTDIRGESIDLRLNPVGNIEETAILCTRLGPAARVLAHFNGTEKDAKAIQDKVAENLVPFASEQVVRLPATINLFQARRSD